MRRILLRKNIEGGFEFGNSLDCSTSTNYVSITSWSSGTGDFTFSTWFRDISTFDYIAHTNTSNYIQTRASTIIRVRIGGNKDFIVSDYTVSGKHNLVVSRISGTLRLYLDGTESSTGGISESSAVAFDKLFGDGVGDGGVYDETGYKTGYGATSSDVSDLWNGGSGANFSDVISTPEGDFKLNETGSDTTAVNDGSDGNGTLTNFPASGMWVAF